MAVRKTGEQGFRLYTSTLRPIGNSLVSRIGIQHEAMIPFAFGDDWGIADTNGHVLIKPRFDEIILIKHGKIAVRKGNQFGVINSSGKWILKPESDKSKALNLLHPPPKSTSKFDSSLFDKVAFEDGDSIVRVYKNKRVGFVDLRTGRTISEIIFEEASPFILGKAIVKNENGYTLMNESGQICPMQMFDFIQFDQSLNLVFYSGEGSERWMGLLGDHCEIIVPGSFREIGHFSESFARCSRTGIGYNYLDQKGDEVFPKKVFSTAEDPQNGFGLVCENNVWQILNLWNADPRPVYVSNDRTAFQIISFH